MNTSLMEETLRVRVPRTLWAQLESRADALGRTRSDVARDLIEQALREPERKPSRRDTLADALAGGAVVPVREVVLMQADALNDVLDWVAERDARAAIALAVDATSAFVRWADLKARELGTTTAEVYTSRMSS